MRQGVPTLSAIVSTGHNIILRRASVTILVVAAAEAAALLLRPRPLPRPTLVATRPAAPTAIKRYAGQWYWLERTTRPGVQLVRTSGADVITIAVADEIESYAVDHGAIAWSERQGRHWAVRTAPVAGGLQRALWSGDSEPLGLSLGEGRVFWLNRAPAPIADGDPFPPLSAALELQTVSVAGGNPTTIGRLWEAEDGVVLGVHAGNVIVAAYRHTRPGNLCLYRMTLDGAPPVRIAGESGNPVVLVTHDGALYWLAPSREAKDASCLQQLDARGKLVSLSDWLPSSLALFETERGVVCLDRNPGPRLWYPGAHDEFPTPVTLPDGYNALAAGEHELLLAPTQNTPSNHALFRMPLP